MEKIDLRKALKSLYLPSVRQVMEVDAPVFSYLMVIWL